MDRVYIRRFFVFLILPLIAGGCTAVHQPEHKPHPELNAKERTEDFDAAWEFVRREDCWLAHNETAWRRARDCYRPKAIEAATTKEFVHVLEQLLDELCDAHTHLNVNYADSWRLPPYDIWAEWENGSAMVREVRRNSDAWNAGVRPGEEIMAIEGRPVRELMLERLGTCRSQPQAAEEEWALLSILAGRHNSLRRFTIRSTTGEVRNSLIQNKPNQIAEPKFESRILPGGIGYMRFSAFDDPGLVAEFDAALHGMKGTRGLILDVRDNSGGDTAVTCPIMGRFLTNKSQYAWMARREGNGLGPRWKEFVEPRGSWTYKQPVVVLVNHWSMSVAEGFAMGMGGMGRARVVGTRMAGLGAGIHRLDLKNCGIGMQASAEPVYQLNGELRSDFRPTLEVQLYGSKASNLEDPILDTGLSELLSQLTGTK